MNKSLLTPSHVLLLKVLSHTLQLVCQAPKDSLKLGAVLQIPKQAKEQHHEGYTIYSNIYILEPLKPYLNLKGQTNAQKPEMHSTLSIQQQRKQKEMRYQSPREGSRNHYRTVMKHGSSAEKKVRVSTRIHSWEAPVIQKNQQLTNSRQQGCSHKHLGALVFMLLSPTSLPASRHGSTQLLY